MHVMDKEHIIKNLGAEIEALIERAIKDAYEQGYEAGQVALRHSVMRAVSNPSESSGYLQTTSVVAPTAYAAIVQSDKVEGNSRAPRGSVTAAINKVLAMNSGLTTTEIRKLAVIADPRISPKSIDNELSRKKDELFIYRDGKWFLKPQIEEKEGGHHEEGKPPPRIDYPQKDLLTSDGYHKQNDI